MNPDDRRDPSLRLRPWASLVLFLSAYSPLMLILVIKDYDVTSPGWLPQNPVFSGILLRVAVFSSLKPLNNERLRSPINNETFDAAVKALVKKS